VTIKGGIVKKHGRPLQYAGQIGKGKGQGGSGERATLKKAAGVPKRENTRDGPYLTPHIWDRKGSGRLKEGF